MSYDGGDALYLVGLNSLGRADAVPGDARLRIGIGSPWSLGRAPGTGTMPDAAGMWPW